MDRHFKAPLCPSPPAAVGRNYFACRGQSAALRIYERPERIASDMERNGERTCGGGS